MITFQSEEINFSLKAKNKYKSWLHAVAKEELKSIMELNYVFCSDAYLLQINQQYLNHDTLTDVVTFDNSEKPNKIEGDIFISIERVQENASLLATQSTELSRVMVHGLLHLLGYRDKTKEFKSVMTQKEDYYLKHLQLD